MYGRKIFSSGTTNQDENGIIKSQNEHKSKKEWKKKVEKKLTCFQACLGNWHASEYGERKFEDAEELYRKREKEKG